METSFILGICIGVVGAFGTGFLKKAGEDLYVWIKGKVSPSPVKDKTPQIVVHFHENMGDDPIQSNISTHLAPASIERLNQVSFDDIEKAIDSAPPMQRDHIANSYIGLKVEWDSYLRTARKTDNGKTLLRLAFDKKYRGRAIICEVPTDEYLMLGILPEGAHIRVSGVISMASTYEVELSNVRLQILHNSMAPEL